MSVPNVTRIAAGFVMQIGGTGKAGVSGSEGGAQPGLGELSLEGFAPTISFETAVSRCNASTYAAPSYPEPLRTFYVDAATGNDSYSVAQAQSPSTPWLTIERFSNAAGIAGDRVYLKGTLSGTANIIRPDNNGTAANMIVYEGWPGETHNVLGGASTLTGWLDNRSYIVLKNINFNNNMTGAPADWDSVLRSVGGDHIWIQGCTLVQTVTGTNMCGITLRRATDCRIEDCTIAGIGRIAINAPDGIYIADGCDDCVIVRNDIGNCGHAAIDVAKESGDDPCANVIIAQNTIHNRWSGGIIATSASTNILVECNDLYDIGVDEPNDVAGTHEATQIAGDDGVWRYNRIWGGISAGIYLQAHTFNGTQPCRRNKVYHNTLYNNGGPPIVMVATGGINATTYLLDNEIDNNLVYLAHQDGQNQWDPGLTFGGYYNGNYHRVWVDITNSAGQWATNNLNGNTFRNNWLARDASHADNACIVVKSAGNDYYNLTQFEAIGSNANNTMVGDPTMTDPGNDDFTLQAGSGCIDHGRLISGVDYLGSAPDAGAYEKA